MTKIRSELLNLYYTLKPLIPRRAQFLCRRWIARHQLIRHVDTWPIDKSATAKPEAWSGWPGGMKFALVLTHDVDTARGHNLCDKLAELEESLDFRSSFNFVPERYTVSADLRRELETRGFEIGVHGLNHDGKYFKNRDIFRDRAIRINRYIKEWNAAGYRSPSMQHRLDWFHDLDIIYDSSTFDNDPFEPQPGGLRRIYPFIVRDEGSKNSYVELPYTLPQDFTLFILLAHTDTAIWERKLDWVAANGGMALINTHPDYMQFNKNKSNCYEYPAAHYEKFLKYIRVTYPGQFWHALPRQMASFWNERYGSIRQ